MKRHLICIIAVLLVPFVLPAQGQQNAHEWPATDPSKTVTESPLIYQHIKPVEYGLREILQLNPVIFQWKDAFDNSHSRMGFVPQEVSDVISDAVHTNKNVSNEDVVPVAVAALQELYMLVKYQQQTLEQMRAENLELKNRINALEHTVYPEKYTP